MIIKHSPQNGFTLIELLVVISVLAAMAGIAVTAIDSYDGEARDQLARVEMNNIANAIYRFKQDTGYFPHEGLFDKDANQYNDNGTLKDVRYQRTNSYDDKNFSFLFDQPTKCEWDTSVTPNRCKTTVSGSIISLSILPWQADVARGWHGPYLTQDSQQHLQNTNCDLGLFIPTPASIYSALEDTYERARSYSDTDSCFAINNKGQWVPRAAAGMPYRYQLDFTSDNTLDCKDNTCIVLISAGKDSIFNSDANPSDDDVVTILRKNG